MEKSIFGEKSKDKNLEPTERMWLLIIAVLILSAVIGYAFAILYVSWPITLGDVNKAGAFGDSFGWLTSAFSGLTLWGLLYTIIQQRRGLEFQREELSLRSLFNVFSCYLLSNSIEFD